MIIIGIHDGHNASACLLVDGKIQFVMQEERLTNEKNYWGFPLKSIKLIMDTYDLKPDDFDCIALSSWYSSPRKTRDEFLNSFNPKKHYTKILKGGIARTPLYRRYAIQRRLKERIESLLELGFSARNIDIVDHHLSHASAAYYGLAESFDKDYLVLTLDGGGGGLCSTVNIGRNGKLERVEATPETSSLGNIYSRVTYMLGFIPWEQEYKLMGMAPYVSEEKTDKVSKLFHKYLGLKPENKLVFEKTIFEDTGEILRRLKKDLDGLRFDWVCAGLQRFTEELIEQWVKECVLRTGIGDVLCSGGVFMNVKANKKISELPCVTSIEAFPSCGDESNSMGAAYYVYHSKVPVKHGINESQIRHCYLGNDVSDKECQQALEHVVKEYPGIMFSRERNVNKAIADLLVRGEVVARCSGRMEFGARALGNRSILADPSRHDVVRIINRMVKNRDFWMPFAPVVSKEKSPLYIKNNKNLKSPYMMMSFNCTDRVSEMIAAVHNADLTARAQILEKAQNPDLYEILDHFEKSTGRGVLLNTSFNLHGYPIVYGPEEALWVFVNSGLRYLVLNNFLVTKNE